MSEREAYVDKLAAQLKEWDAELQKLEARAAGATADARIRYERDLADWRERRQKLRTRLADLRASSDAAWKEIGEGLEASWDEMRRSFDRALAAWRTPEDD